MVNELKVYNPVNLIIPDNKDLFFAYIIGLIDVDGTIEVTKEGKARQIKICLHKSWCYYRN